MPDEREAMAEALPRHEIGEELGRGAWGVVHSAYHHTLGRHLAIKRLPLSFAVDEQVRHRFRAEAKLIASLNHPHIIQVYDFVEHGELCLLLMERLDGGSLWDRFEAEGLSLQASCAAVLATCAGLSHAHSLGVLHRDIKPHNLMYGSDGTLKVTDFGIAKVLGGPQTMATAAGQVLGTPAYISPEQVLGEDIAPATDVYALGIVFYELLSGRLPFNQGESAMTLLYAHAHEDPIPLLDVAPDVPEPLAACAMRAIQRDRVARYQSADEFGADLAKATNRVWDTGWIGKNGLVVIPSGQIAHHLSIPPKLRDTGLGTEATVHPDENIDHGEADSKATNIVDPAELAAVAELLPRPSREPDPSETISSRVLDTGAGTESEAAAPSPPTRPPPHPPPPAAVQRAAPPPPPATYYSAPPQPAPPHPTGSPKATLNALAIVSLVSSLVLGFCCVGTIIGPVTGHIARKQIRDSDGAEEGAGLALAGIIIGYVGVAAWIVYLILNSIYGEDQTTGAWILAALG